MTENASEFVLQLPVPITVGDQSIPSLTIREPTVGDMLAAIEQTGTGVTIKLLALTSNQDEAVIRALPSRQSQKAFQFLGKFLEQVESVIAVKAHAEMLPDTLTVSLRAPIETSGKYCDRLELHEPTLGELAKTDGDSGLKHAITLMSVSSGQIRAVIERMPITEFTEAARYLLAFLAMPATDPATSLN